MKIALILYDSFSNLDFASLLEPLTMLKQLGLQPDLSWQVCALQEQVIDALGVPHPAARVDSLDDFDLVALPGCTRIDQALADKRLLEWLGKASSRPWLAAVGSGVLLLAAAGLLKGKKAAAEESIAERLRSYGGIPVSAGIAEDDAIFSAASTSQALPLAIVLCAQLAGLHAAEEVRRHIGLDRHVPPAGESTSSQPAAPGEGLRYSRVLRKTKESSIEVELELDGSGKHEIHTGLPFYDHMLAQVAVHGLFDLKMKTQGDLEVDAHHTVEDAALALGEAFHRALGDRKGIVRMAAFTCPMDDSQATVVIDFSGRPYAIVETRWLAAQVGSLPTSLFAHFLESFATAARCNLHVSVAHSKDDHHQAEAIFKALGRALDAATLFDERRAEIVPSTKGIIL